MQTLPPGGLSFLIGETERVRQTTLHIPPFASETISSRSVFVQRSHDSGSSLHSDRTREQDWRTEKERGEEREVRCLRRRGQDGERTCLCILLLATAWIVIALA